MTKRKTFRAPKTALESTLATDGLRVRVTGDLDNPVMAELLVPMGPPGHGNYRVAVCKRDTQESRRGVWVTDRCEDFDTAEDAMEYARAVVDNAERPFRAERARRMAKIEADLREKRNAT